MTKNTSINFSSSALYHIPRRLTIQQKTTEERISNRAISWSSLDPRSYRARDPDLTPSSSFRSSPAAAWIRLENTRKCVGCKKEKNNQNVPKYTEKLETWKENSSKRILEGWRNKKVRNNYETILEIVHFLSKSWQILSKIGIFSTRSEPEVNSG